MLEAMVTEGLADHFMLEIAGGDPPIWATALVGVELETWLDRARRVWLDPDFDRDPWFFIGTRSSTPQWAGYAVGFEMTSRYLDANLSQRASTLYAEPASSFIPRE